MQFNVIIWIRISYQSNLISCYCNNKNFKCFYRFILFSASHDLISIVGKWISEWVTNIKINTNCYNSDEKPTWQKLEKPFINCIEIYLDIKYAYYHIKSWQCYKNWYILQNINFDVVKLIIFNAILSPPTCFPKETDWYFLPFQEKVLTLSSKKR